MKYFNLVLLFVATVLSVTNVAAQANASLSVLTQNAGVVPIGGTVNIELTVGNTGPASSIGVNKVRCQLSVPSGIVSVRPNAQQTGLPAGWTILTNNGSVITVCNGSDIIPVGVQRTILISVQGNAIGGPSTVSGQLSFGPGTAVCTGPGVLSGDAPADNTSTSSVAVFEPVPVKLTDFTAALVNCQPVLNWVTQTEINTDRFEIERSGRTRAEWMSIGSIAANGNTSTGTRYNFTDNNLPASANVLYRLKMIDRDGRYDYSEVLRVLADCQTTQMKVYPNPVQNGKLYVSLTGAHGNIEARLLSIPGQLILKSKISNGTNYLNVSRIPDGVYILNITDSNGFDKKIKILIRR